MLISDCAWCCQVLLSLSLQVEHSIYSEMEWLGLTWNYIWCGWLKSQTSQYPQYKSTTMSLEQQRMSITRTLCPKFSTATFLLLHTSCDLVRLKDCLAVCSCWWICCTTIYRFPDRAALLHLVSLHLETLKPPESSDTSFWLLHLT